MSEPVIGGLIDRMVDAVRQPELHMREIPVLIGLGILVVFIVLVVIAIFFVHPSEKPLRHVEEKKLRRSIRIRYLAGTFAGLLAIGTLGSAMFYSSKQEFCASCHEMQTALKNAGKTIHKMVACASCHQEPGISGVFIEKLQLAEMAIAKSEMVGEVSEGPISNEACLRCHGEVLLRVRAKRIVKMKHKEPIEAGFRCLDCHSSKTLFHVEKQKLDNFGMSRCVDCHNQTKASAECATCHLSVGEIPTSIKRDEYPGASLPDKITCSSCHSTKSCLECHSLPIPHPNDWKTGNHAIEGFVSKKLCAECHQPSHCQQCHAASPHGSGWVKEHGQASKGEPSPCASCHRAEDFCLTCHANTSDYSLISPVKKPRPSPQASR